MFQLEICPTREIKSNLLCATTIARQLRNITSLIRFAIQLHGVNLSTLFAIHPPLSEGLMRQPRCRASSATGRCQAIGIDPTK